ncbi:MAG TPA: alpha/beta hydrolase [Cyclobacteriaceae bacterium]|nr:alpha/beta hydrolase [Cyclobacteriaceae bacterium]
MKTIRSKTIVFVTGAFVSHTGWDPWKTYFESKGYICLAPPWPTKEAPPAVLRSKQPNPEVAGLRLNRLIDSFETVINGLPEKPILIGHSLGGMLTQVLLSRGLAEAGVAIHSLPPQGIVPTQFPFYKSAGAALGFFTSTREAYLMSFKKWQYAFTNNMPLEQQKIAYEKNAIPESKLCIRDTLTSLAKVDFSKPRGPLLFTAGDIDHCIPAGLNLTNFKKYKNNKSVTDYKVFPGRNHFVLGQPTWQEDADYILDWLSEH